MVRAKFTVQSSDGVNTVVLTAQYDPNQEEDKAYSKATPSGRIEMQVDNPPAREFFKAGKTYYVDFTEA